MFSSSLRGINFRWMILAVIIALTPAASFAVSVDPYPGLEKFYAEFQSLAAAHPDKAGLETIGQSVEGRPIYALHIARHDGKTRPAALLNGNHHAGEVIGGEVVLGAARRLLDDDGKDQWITSLLDRSEFYIVPTVNPDGFERVISSGGRGGKMGTRKNAHGVDLNRNYPLVTDKKISHPLAGNHRPKSSYYMGEHELSEPETAAIAALAEQHPFYAVFNMHSVAGKFLYPYCHTKKPAPHTAQFVSMGQAFTGHQPHKKYKVQRSYSWYPTLGDADDFFYVKKGAMSVTVEVGTVRHNLKYALLHPSEFWLMNPHDMDYWVSNDRDAVLAGLEKALEITAGKPFDTRTTKP